MELFVTSLSYDASEKDLLDLFAPYRPSSVRLITDRESGRSRGFAFVELYDRADAERALIELDGAPLLGRPIVVKRSLPKDDHARQARQRART